MTPDERVGDVLRRLAPQVLGVLVHRYGDFARCEDAVQEALIAAADAWPRTGVPDHPLGWLSTVAARRYVDLVRADSARERRERAVLDATPRDPLVAPDEEPVRDDLLELLFLCCHPALSASSQVALTLRAVGGLTTAEIAAGSLVPEKTMGQRISRAKQRLREVGARFEPPPEHEYGQRLRVVLHVLYLMFNEGYSTSAGSELRRADLTRPALHLVRRLHERLPESGEIAGLLALMVLTEARSQARTGPGGTLVPLAEQDRSRWDAAAIAEGVDLITRTLATRPLGPYQVQAAIAAVHDEASSTEATDWPQILALYEVLERLAPNPSRHSQPGGRRRHGARTVRGAGVDRRAGVRRPRRQPPPAGGPRPSARAGRRPDGRGGDLSGGRPYGRQPTRAAVPPAAGGREPDRVTFGDRERRSGDVEIGSAAPITH